MEDNLPSPKAIFAGNSRTRPNSVEMRAALRCALVEYAHNHPDPDGLAHSLEHACELPWEYRKALLWDYSLIPAVREAIRNNPIYQEALRRGLQ